MNTTNLVSYCGVYSILNRVHLTNGIWDKFFIRRMILIDYLLRNQLVRTIKTTLVKNDFLFKVIIIKNIS